MSMLTSQSNAEFSKARQRAFIEEWLSTFTGRSNDLLSFEEVKQELRLQDSAYRGLQEIELDKIVGSTGRYRDFTRTFFPKTDRDEGRWRRVSAVASSGIGFPPIEVYKVDEVYFVRDGNHRVSVARMNGAKTIEAYIIEYKTSVPINTQDELDDIILKWEQTRFFEETRLDQIRPGQNIQFTEPGRYRLVTEHIDFHKFVRDVDCSCELSAEEAVASWYDNVYMPVVQLIREQGVLDYFPGRTEADLYAWLILHRATLEKEFSALGYVSIEDIIKDLKQKNSPNPLVRLANKFQPSRRSRVSLKVERAKFLEETELDKLRPAHNLVFTRPESYPMIKEHIRFHKYLKELELSCEISYEEAVLSWYDNVYMPLVQIIRERELLKHFPDQTEADLYLQLVLRRAALEQEMNELGQVPDETIVENLEKESLASPLSRLGRFFRQRVDAAVPPV